MSVQPDRRARPGERTTVPGQGRRAGSAGPGAPMQLRPGRPGLLSRTLLKRGVRPFLLGVDVSSVVAAAALTGRLGVQTLVVSAVLVVLVVQRRLHRGRLSLSVLDDAPALAGRAVAAAFVVVALGDLLDVPRLADPAVLWGLLLQVPLLVGVRALAYAVVREVRRRRGVEHPTLVLGAGRIGGRLARDLLVHPEYGLLPVGMLDDDPLLGPDELPVPLLGGYEQLGSVLVEFGIRDVVVAFGSMPESSMVDVIRVCDRLDCEIFFVPRLFEMTQTTPDMETLWGVPLVRLRKAAFRRPAWRLKRAFDVLVSGAALVLLSPVLALCALAVRREGGPGVLFRQERIGVDGKPFQVLKFRSLRPADETESATRWNVAHDDRLGRVGRLLRTTSLDELPQLWNILRGDMTLVGPRPERPHFVEEFSQVHARYAARHRVPAGLTGWAQVHGLRGDTSIEDRARFDNYYIENWSLWGDLKIVLRTVSSVVFHRGA